MIGTIIAVIFCAIVIIACCTSDSGTSNNTTAPKRNTYTPGNTRYSEISYCECPSCGSPYYDGYCEECGYPDINQGWLGEEY